MDVSVHKTMKNSIYNSAININDKHTLLFNALSGKFVVVKNKRVALEDLSSRNLREEYHAVYNQIIEAGMIIEDDIDEISLLKERIENADNNEHEFILHINPTLDCNFRCWYCYENHIPGSKMNQETLDSILLYISSILHKPAIKSFELGFFGGEPLFFFNDIARKIISHAHSLCKDLNKALHIHFTSNGALLNEEIIEFLSGFSCGFQITLDGGKEFHDKTRFSRNNTGSFDTIVGNVFRLAQSGISVIVRVNYTSENIDSVDSIYESFRTIDEEHKKFLKFDFQRVWQDRIDRYDMTENKIKEIRQKFIAGNFKVLANYIPHNVANSCYGDKLNHVLINYNGDAFGCTARDFTAEHTIGHLDSSGVIHYDSTIVNRRNHAKLSKTICQKCRIAPLCGGGCKQRAYESLDYEGCTLNYSEEDIDNMIMDIFEYSFDANSSK